MILGLVFLKYVSEAFEERQEELRVQFKTEGHDYFMAAEDYGVSYEQAFADELEIRDYYVEKNVFWVPSEARWQMLSDCSKLAPGTVLPWMTGESKPEKMRSVGWLIDNAMEAMRRT